MCHIAVGKQQSINESTNLKSGGTSSAGGKDPVVSPAASPDFVHRLSIPVIRGGLNSNISDILEASGYGTETDIRIDDEYG